VDSLRILPPTDPRTELVLATTPCPYARLEALAAVTVNSGSDLFQAALAMRRTVTHGAAPTQWIAFISSTLHGSDVSTLARLLHAILRLACKTDREVERLYQGIHRADWRLFVGPTACFALTLSDIYHEHDPRFLPGHTAVLIQPESLFARHGITSGEHRDIVSQLVAKKFAAAGRPYEVSAHATGLPKALRFLRDETGAPVSWWEASFEPWQCLISSHVDGRKTQATPAPKRAVEVAGSQIRSYQELPPDAFNDSR